MPHWRGSAEDEVRVQVAICFTMDLRDAWEWADSPPYSERLSSLAFRMGVNSIIDTMAHGKDSPECVTECPADAGDGRAAGRCLDSKFLFP